MFRQFISFMRRAHSEPGISSDVYRRYAVKGGIITVTAFDSHTKGERSEKGMLSPETLAKRLLLPQRRVFLLAVQHWARDRTAADQLSLIDMTRLILKATDSSLPMLLVTACAHKKWFHLRTQSV
jgi:hypothetical protein